MAQNSAVSASAFTASIGVNTHLDTTWTSYGNTAVAINALLYLGVSKVRDSMAAPGDPALFETVAAATGVKFDAYLSLSAFTYDGQISAMRSAVNVLTSVEGINEGDSSLFRMSYGGQTGYAAIAAAQTALYTAIKSDPAASSLTVIAPSYGITADFAIAPDTSAVSDAGNTHEYFGTGNPPAGGIGAFLAQAALVSGSHPVIATEAGYYTGSSLAGTIAAYQTSGVSQLVEAKYDLTLLFDDWQAGIGTTFLYELLDDFADPGNTNSDDHYGLFNADGTPKLAATAIHDLMATLADSGPARTDTFGYQIVGAPSTGNSLLLEKSTGVFELAIWNGIRLSDAVTGAEIATPAVPVTISFGQYVQSVSEYDPLAGTSAVLTWSNVNAISLNLPDHPVLLEITPYAPAQFSLQSFVLPETVASNTSSGNLASALIANATESNPNWVGGVTIAAIGTIGTQGTVSFNPSTQSVTYTAPTYSPLDPTDSFTYTLADAHGNTVTGTVAITETQPANTLYNTTVGARLNDSASGSTLVSLAAHESLYAEASFVTFVGSTDTDMYGGTNATFIAGDGNHSVGAGDYARITLGNGNNTIGLTGVGNVVVTGNGNNLLYKSLGNTSITMGDGNQTITAGGQNNVISVGVGNSIIYVGADGAPDGNESITVAGGTNIITAGGTGDIILVQGGNNNQVVALAGSATVTVDTGSTTVVAQGAGSVITILSGSNHVEASGDADTITLGNGGTFVYAAGSSNQITTGSGFASIDFLGQHDTIDASRGEVILTEQGSHNTIILAAAGGLPTQIYGDVIAGADTLDLRTALASTNWNGQRSTLADYLLVRDVGSASVIAIDADGKGAGAAATIAVLYNSGNLTYAGLLAQAVLPTVAVALDLQQSTLAESVAAGTPTNLWTSIIANATGSDLNGAAGMTIAAVGTTGTKGSISFDLTTQSMIYTPPAYSPLTPTDSFTYSLADALGNTATGTVAITEIPPPDTLYDTAAGARINAPASGWTLVSLASGQSLYSDASFTTFLGGADTNMYGGTNATIIAGDGNHNVGAGDHASITLGNGNNIIGLEGAGNVVVTGNGNNVLWKSTGGTRITMGNGNENITVGGECNVIAVGVGNSTINMGTDGAPSSNDHLTVAGGANTIDAVGSDENIHIEGGTGNQIVTQGGYAVITVDAGSTAVIAQKFGNVINILSGSNDVQTNGDGNIITLGSGGTDVWAGGNSNRITTGSGFASIDFIGHYNTIDATHGQVILTEQGSHNIILLAAASTPTQIYGDVIAAADILDLRPALGATTWNGQQSTLSDYLLVRDVGNASVISIDADGKGPGAAADIAVLNNSSGLTYAGLLAHAATSIF